MMSRSENLGNFLSILSLEPGFCIAEDSILRTADLLDDRPAPG